MNILFISSLSHSLSTGPAWSVPARIAAQEKIDNVFWVNLSEAEHDHWKEVKAYHNIREFSKCSFSALPAPFNKPDVVVFEGFYGGLKEIAFALDCWRMRVPYIIVPRSSLTYQAMHNKSRWKKEIAHFMFYDRFVKKSLAVQYLTEQEYQDSKYRFDGPHFILPNGFNKPQRVKECFSKDQIKAIFIGRIDIHQKGLDLLLGVLDELRDELIKVNFSLVLHGPKLEDYYQVEEMIKKMNLKQIVTMGGEILGEAKAKALLESDVFFLTSRFEGHPMGLLEAMSYGLPCVITTGTNMQPEVDAYNAGWTSNTNPNGIKQALLNMIANIGNLHDKSNQAKSLSERYEWRKLSMTLHEYIRNSI